MKILVAGANGQVATELRLQGESSPHQVITLGRDDLDIRFEQQVQNAFAEHQPDIVINAAAYTAVDKAEEETEQAYAINRDGAKNLAAACEMQAIPFLHISTDYVFDGSKQQAYSESDAVSPLGVYGESKWAGEQAVRENCPQHIIVRTSWVFSQHGGNFVKTIARVSAERDELRVVNDQLGSPTSAAGIANMLLQLCDRYEQQQTLPWGTYHFAGAPFTSWHGFAEQIVDLAYQKGLIDHSVKVHAIPSSEYPTPAKRPANSQLQCEKLKKALGIEADDWQMQLEQVINGLAEQN